MKSPPFERFAGASSILAGVAGFLYALSFIILRDVLLSAIFLTLLGAIAIAGLLAVYFRLRETDSAFALFALLFMLVGAIGSSIHGGYDLANAVNPPTAALQQNATLPSQVDPRGLATFGFGGVGLFVAAWLIVRGGQFAKGLGYVGYVSAILLLVLYFGRLIILDPSNPIIAYSALVNGFIVSPVLYIWLGYSLWTGKK